MKLIISKYICDILLNETHYEYTILYFNIIYSVCILLRSVTPPYVLSLLMFDKEQSFFLDLFQDYGVHLI